MNNHGKQYFPRAQRYQAKGTKGFDMVLTLLEVLSSSK